MAPPGTTQSNILDPRGIEMVSIHTSTLMFQMTDQNRLLPNKKSTLVFKMI